MSVSGYIATSEGFVEGEVELDGGRISAIHGNTVDEARARDGKKQIVIPGFVDLHVHGGGGYDMMDAGGACDAIARQHARHGTTAMLTTTLTAPRDDLFRAFGALREVMANQSAGTVFGARILGAHLEGPYISDGKLGAQPPYARDFDRAELNSLHVQAPIKLITLAPELPHAAETIRVLTAAGFIVQLGHSEASYEAGREGFDSGARGVTHLFNAMSGMHHRKPGLVGAALAHAQFAEIIPDMQHVHEGAIRAAIRAIPCVYCVTDSTAAAGMPDGEYHLGRHTVTKCMGGVRLADGTLAGSTLTMDVALRNLVEVLQLDFLSAVRRTSTYACEYLRVFDRGRIAVGAYADLVVMDRNFQVHEVFVEGVPQSVQW